MTPKGVGGRIGVPGAMVAWQTFDAGAARGLMLWAGAWRWAWRWRVRGCDPV
jgi:hypothetical protein